MRPDNNGRSKVPPEPETMTKPDNSSDRPDGDLRAANRRLRQQIAEIRAGKAYVEKIIDTIQTPLVVLDSDLVVRKANKAFYTTFDLGTEKTIGSRIFDIGDGQWDTPALREFLKRVPPGTGRAEDLEVAYAVPKSGRHTMSLSAQRVGHLPRILLAMEDITERKEAERRQELLIDELNHRVKNVLSTVQAILTQTARRAGSAKDLEEGLSGRLRALNRGHEILVRADWQPSDLTTLMAEVLQPYGFGERIAVECETIRLRPRAALAFNLILHELATNAAKYGALSVSGGRIDINCRISPRDSKQAEFVWREYGGPSVAPPIRKGFGSRLIERSAEHELFGSARMEFRPDGLKCVLEFAAGDLTEGHSHDT